MQAYFDLSEYMSYWNTFSGWFTNIKMAAYRLIQVGRKQLYRWQGLNTFYKIQSALLLQLKLQFYLDHQTYVLCSACCVLECQKNSLVPTDEATSEKYPVEVMPGPTSFSSWCMKVLMIFHAFQSHQSSWLLICSGKPIHMNCTVNHQCSHLLFNKI